MILSSQLGSIKLIPSKGFFQFEKRLIEVWRDPRVGPTDLCKALLDYLKELAVRGIPELEVELVSLPEDFVVWPGHGPSTTIAEEKSGNPFVNQSKTGMMQRSGYSDF